MAAWFWKKYLTAIILTDIAKNKKTYQIKNCSA